MAGIGPHAQIYRAQPWRLTTSDAEHVTYAANLTHALTFTRRMGTYDTLLVRCPDCRELLEFQTKARYGHGGEFEYFATDETITEPPHSTAKVSRSALSAWMAEDLEGAELTCRPCGRRVKLELQIRLVPVRMLNRGRKFDERTGECGMATIRHGSGCCSVRWPERRHSHSVTRVRVKRRAMTSTRSSPRSNASAPT
jgi:hypothetical protein